MLPYLPSRSLWAACASILLLLAMQAGSRVHAAVDLSQRTLSSSRQFTVYCPDVALRSRIANFAEEVKAGTLSLLGEQDRWKHPIVLTIDRAQPGASGANPVRVGLCKTDSGLKVEIEVLVGENPADVNLQKHLVRAVLLEFAFRHRVDAVRGGEVYAEPPWWLVEGTVQWMQSKLHGSSTDVFRAILDTNKVPGLDHFLAQKPDEFGETARAIEQACAFCLVQLLTEQPGGQGDLGRLLRRLPDGLQTDPVAALVREFPALSADAGALQKWWTLGLARFSARDRYRGLSPEETDAELAVLTQLELPTGKGQETRTFSLADFPSFLKNPASRGALVTLQSGIVALSARANALYRPVLAEYDQILNLLSRGKTGGVKGRIEKIEAYREVVLRNTADIADYLNWFEATQTATRSDAFRGYLQAANELTAPAKRVDPVSIYLDEIAADL